MNAQWEHFASKEYGTALVTAILEDGLEDTMDRVHALRAAEPTRKAETVRRSAVVARGSRAVWFLRRLPQPRRRPPRKRQLALIAHDG